MLRLLRATWPIVRPVFVRHKWSVGLLALFGALSGYLATFAGLVESGLVNGAFDSRAADVPALMSTELDLGFADEEPSAAALLRRAAAQLDVAGGALALLGAYVVAFVIAYVAGRLRAAIGSEVLERLRGAAMRNALGAESDRIPSKMNVAGQMMSAIHGGASATSSAYQYLVDAGQYVFTLVVALIAVAGVGWRFAVFCVLVIAAQLGISVWQARRLRARRSELDSQRNELNGYTDEVLSKRELILAHERLETYHERVQTKTSEYAKIDRALDIEEVKGREAQQLVENLGRLAIIVSALVFLLVDRATDTGNAIGSVWFLLSIYGRVLDPAMKLLARYDSLGRSSAVARTFEDLLRLEPSPPSGSTAPTPPVGFRFEDVTFRYTPNGRDVLQRCTFAIPAGKITMLIGPSGCGKSTVARLLLGFWQPTSGRILLGGRPIEGVSRQDVRWLASYVAQEELIVDEFVRDNLEWASERGRAPSDAEMVQSLRTVRIDDARRPVHPETPARELSGGQKQRLSVARVLLDKAPVLVLDEPMAGVDAFTLDGLLEPFERALRTEGRTTLIVTHRMMFSHLADHVVVMSEEGTIKEEGGPELFERAPIVERVRARAPAAPAAARE